MRIAELARRTGTSPRSLRYYEEQGLLAPTRTPGGMREYGDDSVDHVILIQYFLAAGLNSATIATMMPCACTHRTTPAMVDALLRRREVLDRRVRELTAMRDLADVLIMQARERLDGVPATVGCPE